MIFLRKQEKSYSDPASFRPITISSYFGKIAERLIEVRLRQFFRIKKVLDPEQEGFQAHKTTVEMLYNLKIKCLQIKEKRQVGALESIDFENASDSVWLEGLLHIVHACGVKGKLLLLVEDILLNRSLPIEINSYKSPWFGTTVGLPQGSVISPPLSAFFVTSMFKNMQ